MLSVRFSIVQASQHRFLKNTADDRGLLQGLLLFQFESIDARHQNTLKRVWNVDRLQFARSNGVVLFHYNNSGIEKRSKQFFEEKRIPFRTIQN